VQGSAADIVKAAMIRIDEELSARFVETQTTHSHRRRTSTSRLTGTVLYKTGQFRNHKFAKFSCTFPLTGIPRCAGSKDTSSSGFGYHWTGGISSLLYRGLLPALRYNL